MFVSSFLYIPNGNLEGVITTLRACVQILWCPFHLEFCEYVTLTWIKEKILCVLFALTEQETHLQIIRKFL